MPTNCQTSEGEDHHTQDQGSHRKGEYRGTFLGLLNPISLSQSLPEFGPYLKEKEKKIAGYKASIQPVSEFLPAIHRPSLTPSSTIPSVQVISLSLSLSPPPLPSLPFRSSLSLSLSLSHPLLHHPLCSGHLSLSLSLSQIFIYSTTWCRAWGNFIISRFFPYAIENFLNLSSAVLWLVILTPCLLPR